MSVAEDWQICRYSLERYLSNEDARTLRGSIPAEGCVEGDLTFNPDTF